MKFKSGTLTQASGRLGGMVASHNRGGMYFRAGSTPTNPNTSRQQTVRAGFGSIVQRWTQLLTSAQRAGWENYAEQVPVTNVFGDPISLTGQQHYIRSNSVRVQLDLSIIDTAPTILNTGEPVTSIEATTAETLGVIGITGTTLSTTVNIATETSASAQLLFQLGDSVNESRQSVSGPMQMALTGANTPAAGLGATDIALSADFADMAQEQALVIGQFRIARFRLSYLDGRLSQPFSGIFEVVDDPV